MFDALLGYSALQWQSHPALAALGALGWGLACVLFSPCHLAAIPVMAAHAAGYTGTPLTSPAQAGRIGAITSLGFALGYFLAITALGIGCALLGRMVDLVDEHFWMLPAGALLLWLGISLWREHDCSAAGLVLRNVGQRLGLGPVGGSVALGTGYGLLSSGCTLAFLAPLLLLSLPHGLWASTVTAAAFGLGHCLPMALVGVAAPLARRMLHACSLKGLVVPQHLHGHEEEGLDAGHQGHSHEHHERHHMLERLFRKTVALAVCLGGLALLSHAFWE